MTSSNSSLSQAQFDTIVNSARADKAFCDRIVRVMEKSLEERKVVIEAWIEESKENGAPTEVVDMLLLLLDDDYAEKSLASLIQH